MHLTHAHPAPLQRLESATGQREGVRGHTPKPYCGAISLHHVPTCHTKLPNFLQVQDTQTEHSETKTQAKGLARWLSSKRISMYFPSEDLSLTPSVNVGQLITTIKLCCRESDALSGSHRHLYSCAYADTETHILRVIAHALIPALERQRKANLNSRSA